MFLVQGINCFQVFHFGLLLLPLRLSFDWSMDAIPPIQSLVYDWRNLLSIVFYTSFIYIIRLRSLSRYNANLIVLMSVPFLPATNLFSYVGLVAAERLVYLPSVGFCLLVAFGIRKLKSINRFLTKICFFILLLTMAQKTRLRSNDWMNEFNLFSSAITINPPKGNLQNDRIDGNPNN